MSGSVIRTLGYGGKALKVVFFPDITPPELDSILQTVFGYSGNVVGVHSSDGVVIPIALACRNPMLLPEETCTLLISNASSIETDSLPTPPSSSREMPSYSYTQPPAIPEAYDAQYEEEYDDQDDYEDVAAEDPKSRYMHEIFRFLAGLRSKKILSEVQCGNLEENLLNGSTLLFSAYQVAVSARDTQYFSEICCDVARSLDTEEGRNVVEAQDEILRVCESLYLSDFISESKLLYLTHLILICDESVATIYDQYQDSQNAQSMAKDLYLLSKTHPQQSRSEDKQASELDGPTSRSQIDYGGDDEDEEDEEDSDDFDDDDEDELNMVDNRVFSPNTTKTMHSRLKVVVYQLHKQDIISLEEGQILLELIAAENEYVIAAYMSFENDNNVAELQDTLMRCAKLEIRKRKMNREQAKLDQRRSDNIAAAKQAIAEESDESESDYDSDEGYENDDTTEDDEAQVPRWSVDSMSLDEVLTYLGRSYGVVLDNQWANTVPETFLNLVFRSALQKILTIGQAKALCDLFQAQYDLVRGAWEVYLRENDERDLLDTLKRVVRDLSFDDQGNVTFQGMPNDPEPLLPSPTTDGVYATSTSTDIKEKEQVSVSVPTISSETDSPQSKSKAEAEAAKASALADIKSVKIDLLKHSLTMMKTQNLISETSAAKLLLRAEQGDELVDAAIEQYANDRDVGEFLESLQLLSNMTPEQVNDLISSATEQAAVDEQKEEKDDEEEEEEEEEEEDEEEEEEEEEEPPTAPPSAPSQNQDMAEQWMQIFPTKALETLYAQGIFSQKMYSTLCLLLEEKNSRILAAFDVFRDMQDTEDLIDSLKRIGRFALELEGDVDEGEESYESPYAQSAEGDEEEGEEPGSYTAEESKADEREPMLPIDDQKKVIDIFAGAGAFNQNQITYLKYLIDSKDATIRKMFVIYETERDIQALISGLYDLLPNALRVPGTATSTSTSTEATAEEESDEDSDDEEVDLDDLTPKTTSTSTGTDTAEDTAPPAEKVEQQFLKVIQEMQLSHLETAALRLAIARDDSAIKAALELFKRNLDKEALTNNLRNVARHTVETTLDEQGYEIVADESAEENEAEDVEDYADDFDAEEEEEEKEEEEEEEEEVSPSSSTGSAGFKESKQAEARPAGSDGTMNSKAARDHVFPMLIAELTKESIISERDGVTLKQFYEGGSPVIHAALDCYDNDSEMAELVDTLQRIASTSSAVE